MLFELFSQVLGVKESIFGVKILTLKQATEHFKGEITNALFFCILGVSFWKPCYLCSRGNKTCVPQVKRPCERIIKQKNLLDVPTRNKI